MLKLRFELWPGKALADGLMNVQAKLTAVAASAAPVAISFNLAGWAAMSPAA